ncbi:MAG: hypothetical protein ACREAA_22135, partial [Candidatus Polarisedimenticolia bacterium]
GAGTKDEEPASFTDTNIYGTLGGPVVRDHLWYFVAVERFDEEIPVVFEDRSTSLRTFEGWRNFAKLTWQGSMAHKLTLQVNQDPVDTFGNYIGQTINPETDFRLGTDGTLPQLTWTAILSPALLMQVVFSYLDGRVEIEPVSEDFRLVETDQVLGGNGTLNARLPCFSLNCEQDEMRRLKREEVKGTNDFILSEDGAYNVRSNVNLGRATMRTDFSYTLDDRLGQHSFRSGFLLEAETYEEDLVVNPVITETSCSIAQFPCALPPADPLQARGSISILVYDPAQRSLTADSYNMGGYIQDSWKIRPNLTLNLGARIDRESVNSLGFTSFDPDKEAVEVQRRFDIVREAAIAASYSCTHTPGRLDGEMTQPFTPLPGSPALQFDVDRNGEIDLNGAEREIVLTGHFTTESERRAENFTIENTNLSPRLSVSWDPWNDGKTKVYGTFGRYYDRLFLGTVVTDQEPSTWVAIWPLASTVGGNALPGELSLPLSTSVSVPQTDRDLRTPHTDEWTAGFERELAPEWSVGVTYISRLGEDLLQDKDMNHISCEGFDETYGVDPHSVCGDGGQLDLDRFGAVRYMYDPFRRRWFTALSRNGTPDLYTLNPNFNQVLRVGNFNASRYRAWELTLKKRLHRNWQMQGSYTWSTAEGEAEGFASVVGNDPAVSDKASGYLSYDQRHVFKYQVVAHLPHEILVGGTFTWASGLPYTFVSNVEDYDDHSLLTPQRVFSVTGKLNDQRNESQLTVDGRVEKRFTVGGMQMTAFLAA